MVFEVQNVIIFFDDGDSNETDKSQLLYFDCETTKVVQDLSRFPSKLFKIRPHQLF